MQLNFPEFSGRCVEEQIRNCMANLKKPNVKYPNGRMSHDVEAEYLDKLMDDFYEHRLYGAFYADGSFAHY